MEASLVKTEEGNRQLTPLQEAKGWADIATKAKMLPEGTNPFQAMAIVETGREIGIPPLQAIRSMNFIKGRLTMNVQLQLALAKRGGVKLASLAEKEGVCTATLTRGDEKITCEYTIADAKKAGLVRAGGSYDKYQKQMLRWRAIGDALRLIAPDFVMGLLSPEEAEVLEPLRVADVEIEDIEVQAEPQASQPQGDGDAGVYIMQGKKHAGKTISAVYSEDAQYLEWVRDKAKPSDDKRAVMQFFASLNKPQEAVGEQPAPPILDQIYEVLNRLKCPKELQNAEIKKYCQKQAKEEEGWLVKWSELAGGKKVQVLNHFLKQEREAKEHMDDLDDMSADVNTEEEETQGDLKITTLSKEQIEEINVAVAETKTDWEKLASAVRKLYNVDDYTKLDPKFLPDLLHKIKQGSYPRAIVEELGEEEIPF